MKRRTKPTDWKLKDMTDDELLRLGINKLKQRTLREGEKMDEKFAAGDRDEKQRSKFYAIWYAFEALRIYAYRKGVNISEPFQEGEDDYKVTNDHGKMTYPATDGHITPRRPSLNPISLPVPEGEVILRIDTWREDNRREHFWEFWKPKYGTQHLLALTEKGVYDVTEAVEKQTT